MTVWFAISAASFLAMSLLLARPSRHDPRGGMGAALFVRILLKITLALLVNLGIASIFFLRAHGGVVPKLLVGAATLPAWIALGKWARGMTRVRLKLGPTNLEPLRARMARMEPSELLAALEPAALRRLIPHQNDRSRALLFVLRDRLEEGSASDDLLRALHGALRNEHPGQTLPIGDMLTHLPDQGERALTVWMPALWPPAEGEPWCMWVTDMLILDGWRGAALARIVREHKIDFAARDKEDPCLLQLLSPTDESEGATRAVLALGAHVNDHVRERAEESQRPELIQLLAPR